LLADCQVREVKPFMDFAILAFLVFDLLVSEILDPVLGIDCSSEDDDDAIEGLAVAGVGHDGRYFVFEVDEILKLFQLLAGVARPIGELVLGAVREDGVGLVRLGEFWIIVECERELEGKQEHEHEASLHHGALLTNRLLKVIYYLSINISHLISFK
jgi:hypothetical protein